MLNQTQSVMENGVFVDVCVAVYLSGEFERELVVDLQASGITASEFGNTKWHLLWKLTALKCFLFCVYS